MPVTVIIVRQHLDLLLFLIHAIVRVFLVFVDLSYVQQAGIAFFLGDQHASFGHFGINNKQTHYDSSSSEDEA
jgi:hypothetical protein